MLAHPTESNKCKAQHLASQLVPRTSGNARLGLATSQPVTLETTSVHLVPREMWGLFGNNAYFMNWMFFDH